MFYALKKDSLLGANAQRFFASFSIKDIPATDGRLYADTTAGLVVSFPVQLQANPQLTRLHYNGWNIKGYGGTDVNTGVYIAKYEKRPVPGSEIINDSTLFAEVRKGMKDRMNETKYEELKVAGYNASYFEGEVNGVQGRFLNIIRGNTNLGIMVAGDAAVIHQPVFENIFRNIKAVPYRTTQWKPYTLSNKSLTLFAPAVFTYETDSTDERSFFVSYDSLSATNVMVTIDTVKKYWWYSSDSSFWSFSKKSLGVGDSLISSHISKKGNIGTNDMLVKMANTQTFTRTKQYQYGNVIFGITIRGELDLVNGANANNLMEDVQFNSPIVEFNILESKADLILNDLSSKDSAVVEEAYDEARTARFDSSNIAALHECLLKKYPAPFEYGSVSDINERIAYRLATLASPSTITFVCANYDGLVGDKEYIRTSLLELLSKITTKQSYDSLFCLLKKHPADKLPISFAANITDSLKLTANYSEDILGYIKDTARGMQMTTIVNRLNDSSLITLNRIRQCEKDFIVLSKYDLSRSEHNWRSSNLVEILGKIKTQNSFAAIRGYLNVKDVKYVKKKAAITLIKNNQPVSAVVLNNMAADRELRSLLYEDMKDMKKQALFPKLYLTQKSLGE
jgi:hypothetical protein